MGKTKGRCGQGKTTISIKNICWNNNFAWRKIPKRTNRNGEPSTRTETGNPKRGSKPSGRHKSQSCDFSFYGSFRSGFDPKKGNIKGPHTRGGLAFPRDFAQADLMTLLLIDLDLYKRIWQMTLTNDLDIWPWQMTLTYINTFDKRPWQMTLKAISVSFDLDHCNWPWLIKTLKYIELP